ncbi:O-antigen ligase family protein [Pelagibacterium luteolum]|uniref:O-antigen ligase n=1 Tax=Pelagibacterium luteolum TaxID=440168 RepID=A0A1G7S266_9HYPH|nr:O-antigen ligase family protein [Pelagibacterium luteolum]SDG17112.1 O-antigen ligase [Pelagibacterium luteolum]
MTTIGNRLRYGLAPLPQSWLTTAILIFLALIPIPLGANRPLVWIIGGIALGIFGTLIGVMGVRRASREKLPMGIVLVGGAFAVHILALLIQLLPIGYLLPSLPGLADISTVQISLSPGDTVLMLIRALSYALLFLIVFMTMRDRIRSRAALYGMYAILCAHAALALIMFRAGDTMLGMEKWAYAGAVTGTFVNRNSLATFMAFGFVLGVTLLLDTLFAIGRRRLRYGRQDRDWLRPILIVIGLGLIVTALLGSQSRMGAIAACAGALVVLAITAIRLKRLPFNPALLAAGLVLLLAPALYLNLEGLMGRFATVDQSWSIRAELYRQVRDIIMLRPLTGIGGGAFEVVFPLFHEGALGSDRLWDKTHSSYLALWSELGLIAGSAVPASISAAAILMASKLRYSRAFMPQITAAVGIITTAALHATVDFSLEIQAVAYWFTAFIAIGLASLYPQSSSRTIARNRSLP